MADAALEEVLIVEFKSVSDAEAVRRVDDLADYLHETGIVLNPTCELARWMAIARQMPMVTRTGELPGGLDAREYYGVTLSVIALADAVLQARGSSAEPDIRQRLPSLGKAVPMPRPSPKSHSSRNTVLEILCAGALAQFADEVRMLEPDVTGVVQGAGRVGIACKAVYGSVDAAISRIREGAKQIRGRLKAGDIDRGFVVVDITNLLPHEELLAVHPENPRLSMTFMDMAGARDAVRQAVEHIMRPLSCRMPFDRLPGPPSAVVAIAWAAVRTEGIPTFVRTSYSLVGAAATDADVAVRRNLVEGLKVGG